MDHNNPLAAMASRQPQAGTLERRRQALPVLGALVAAVAGMAISCGGDQPDAELVAANPDPQGVKATTLGVRLNDPLEPGLFAGRPHARHRARRPLRDRQGRWFRPGQRCHRPGAGGGHCRPGRFADVVLDPAFGTNQTVFWTFSEAGAGGAGTAVARGRLSGSILSDVAVIYRQTPKVGGGNHFGSRLAFRSDGTLYVTLGDRNQDLPEAPTADHAQSLAKTLGKVIRINRDGSPAAGNPGLGAGALAEIWSYGHRNPQGAAVRPGTDDLWLTEHGPRGGDELNAALAGKNYGWPLRSYGCPYSFSESAPECRPGNTGGVHAPTFEEPKAVWLPVSTAPSGLMFYTGSRFPEWQGHVFAGALAGQTLWHVPVNAGTQAVAEKESIAAVAALGLRIRDVKQGPDGWIYLLSTEGRVIRLER